MAEISPQPRLSRADRLKAAAGLSELADEIERISGWLDRYGDDADKAAVMLECAARDCRAAAWVIAPADHELPANWLAQTGRFRPL